MHTVEVLWYFCRIFLDPQTKARKIRGIFRSIFRKKIRSSEKKQLRFKIGGGLCRRATLTNRDHLQPECTKPSQSQSLASVHRRQHSLADSAVGIIFGQIRRREIHRIASDGLPRHHIRSIELTSSEVQSQVEYRELQLRNIPQSNRKMFLGETREGHSLANGEGRDGIRNRNRSAIASNVVHSVPNQSHPKNTFRLVLRQDAHGGTTKLMS